MPTSTYAHVLVVLQYLEQTQPASILDIGLGNGKMGFLARDLLDVMLGARYHRRDWQVRIDGIEVFGDYVQAHQRAIYDDIHIGDAFDVIDRLGAYDMIVVGDVLEHFERERAVTFLDKCAAHSLAWILLNIPLGERWTQPDIYGNEYERHLSFWSMDEFQPLASQVHAFEFPHLGTYGSFLISPAAWMQHRAAALGPGTYGAAADELARALGAAAPSLAGELRMVELLVQAGRYAEARDRVGQATAAFPEAAELTTLRGELEKLA